MVPAIHERICEGGDAGEKEHRQVDTGVSDHVTVGPPKDPNMQGPRLKIRQDIKTHARAPIRFVSNNMPA